MSDSYAQSGSSTSRETADHRMRFKDDVLFWVTVRGVAGATWSEVAARFAVHHGEASAVLSRLHKDGLLARLTERQGRNHIYVRPEFVDGRPTEPYGGRPRVVADTLTLQRNLDALRADYDRLVAQLATPPEGWSTFGTNIYGPDKPIEWWGTDESGLPIWERPKQVPAYVKHDGEWVQVDDLPPEALVALTPYSAQVTAAISSLKADLEDAAEELERHVAETDTKIEAIAAQLVYLDMSGGVGREVAHNIRSILDIPEG